MYYHFYHELFLQLFYNKTHIIRSKHKITYRNQAAAVDQSWLRNGVGLNPQNVSVTVPGQRPSSSCRDDTLTDSQFFTLAQLQISIFCYALYAVV